MSRSLLMAAGGRTLSTIIIRVLLLLKYYWLVNSSPPISPATTSLRSKKGYLSGKVPRCYLTYTTTHVSSVIMLASTDFPELSCFLRLQPLWVLQRHCSRNHLAIFNCLRRKLAQEANYRLWFCVVLSISLERKFQDWWKNGWKYIYYKMHWLDWSKQTRTA